MSAAIYTKYLHSGKIQAWTKDKGPGMQIRLPYDFGLHHSKRHPAAAKALAEKLGWAGLWIVGHNEDNSICAVLAIGFSPADMAHRVAAVEGEDYFIVERAPL